MTPVRAMLGLSGGLLVLGVLAPPATGAVFIRLITTSVHRGGLVRIESDADRLAVYALPARRLPCARDDTCSDPIHRSRRPSGAPFVFLGRTQNARSFAIRLSPTMRAGRYFVFVWCAACGNSLIVAGTDPSGRPQPLDVLEQ